MGLMAEGTVLCNFKKLISILPFEYEIGVFAQTTHGKIGQWNIKDGLKVLWVPGLLLNTSGWMISERPCKKMT